MANGAPEDERRADAACNDGRAVLVLRRRLHAPPRRAPHDAVRPRGAGNGTRRLVFDGRGRDMKRLLVGCFSLMLSAVSLAFQAPAGQSEFVPVNSLPPADQLPAAPLLIAAYAFVWVATLFYVWTIWRRL